MDFSGLASPLQYRLDVGSLVELSGIIIIAHIIVIYLIDELYALLPRMWRLVASNLILRPPCFQKLMHITLY